MSNSRRFLVIASALALLWGPIPMAIAAWQASNAGTAYTRATSVPQGNTPTLSVNGQAVTVNWAQTTVNGSPATSYTIKRYDANTNALQTINSNCSGAINALNCTENSVPDGSWKYSVTPKYQNWLGAESGKSSTVTVVSVTPPVVTELIIASNPNNGKGLIKAGGTYNVYANIQNTVDTATTNVSAITSGQTAATMSVCASNCTIHGVTYGYKSGTLTAGGALPQGSLSFSVTATNAGGSHTKTNTVTVDNTRPTLTGLLEMNNVGGNTATQPDPGDQIIVTFTERLAVNTLCSGWSNNETNQTTTGMVTIHNGNNNTSDSIDLTSAACGTFNYGEGLGLQSIEVGAHGYLQDADITFTGSTVTWNVTTFKLTITLGTLCTPSATCGTPAKGPVATGVYRPNPAIQDLAGNQILGVGCQKYPNVGICSDNIKHF